MLLLIVIAVWIAIVVYTRQLAVERGRSGLAWLLLGIVVGVACGLAGWISAGLSLLDSGDSAAPAMFGIFIGLLGPLIGASAVLAMVLVLPEGVPRVGGTRWAVHCMPSPEMAAFDCDLVVASGQVRVGDAVVIAAADLTEIVADGECLRLGWGGRSLLLFPLEVDVEGFGAARVRAKLSQGLARRVARLLGKA
jgi:hypothetical protein